MDNYTLEPYQVDAIERDWQAYLGGQRTYSPMFDDPGVGKTPKYVVLSSRIAQKRKADGHRQPVIWLITENTAKESQREKVWEFDPRFDESATNDPLSVIVLEGNAEQRNALIQLSAALRVPWVIMNYNQLVIHAETLLKNVGEDDILICDEADLASPSGQNVSQRFEVAKALACKVHYRIAATGSMIRNRVDTLYNLFLLLDPDWINWEDKVELGVREVVMPSPAKSAFWGRKYRDFLERYGVWDGEKLIDIRRKEELHSRLVEYGASLTSKEVLGIEYDEPEIITHPLSAGQRHNYELVKKGYKEMADEVNHAMRRMYGDERAQTLQSFLAQISYARFVPGLSPENYKRIVQLNQVKRLQQTNKDEMLSLVSYLNLDRFVDDGGNARIDQAVKMVAEFDWSGPGGLIFYSPFKEVVKELSAAMDKYGHGSKFGLITGDVSARERDTVRRRVMDGTCRIVGISNAGGRSIDLVQLNTAVSLITPWTHTETKQAMGRVDRYGQTQTVRTVYLAAEDTIETKHMLGLLGGKGRASDDVQAGKRGRRMHFETISDAWSVIGWL